MEFLAAQGPDVLNARVETFMQYETALLMPAQIQIASAIPTYFVAVPDERLGLVPLVWTSNITPVRREYNITLWIREIEMAMRSSLISLEHQRVSLAISKLDGRAREGALTCNTSVELAFLTCGLLKLDLLQVFSPPNQADRVR